MKTIWSIGLSFSLAAGIFAAETPELDRCIEAQQQAIVDLLAAMKDARNVINRQAGKGSANQQNPFRNKQRYELPMLKKEGNPEAQLEQLRDEQEQLLREMGEPAGTQPPNQNQNGQSKPGSGTMSSRQGEIAEKLEKMAADGKSGAELRQHLQAAAAAGRTAEKALNSNEKITARNAAMKDLAEIKKAIDEVRTRSDRETATAANEIRRELNRAQRELKDGQRNRSAAALNTAGTRAAEAARSQLGSGRYANAETMNGIARSIGRSQSELFKIDISRALESLERLKKEITATTRNNDPTQGLRENLRRLQDLVREIKYLQRDKGDTPTAEAPKIWEDLELTAQSIDTYAAELAGRKLAAATELERLAGKNPDNSPGRSLQAAIPPAEKLIAETNAMISGLNANRHLHIFNKDQAPAEYRPAVDKYFEVLSETSQPAGKKP